MFAKYAVMCKSSYCKTGITEQSIYYCKLAETSQLQYNYFVGDDVTPEHFY